MKKITILLLLAILLLPGCTNEELIGRSGNMRDGELAQVNLRIDGAAMSDGLKSRSKASAEEAEIANLRVLIFDDRGAIVTNKKYSSDPGKSLRIETYSGSKRKFCIVANISKDEIDRRLNDIASYGELEKVMATSAELGLGLNTPLPLVMTAIKEDVDIYPGTSTITEVVKLRFLVAKLTLRVVDATPADEEVTISDWAILDAPAGTYIFGSDVDANPNPEQDNKDEYWITTGSHPFEEIDQVNKTSAQTVYLLENRRGGRVPKDLPGNPYDGMAVDDKDSKGKTWYRPKRATAIMINAIHTSSGTPNRVKIYIYLGEDNHSDYNIRRGYHYDFTVTVKGFNEIGVDTNVDYAP